MGTLRDLDLDEAGDHPAPQRRPAIFFMIHQYLLFLSFDAGAGGGADLLQVFTFCPNGDPFQVLHGIVPGPISIYQLGKQSFAHHSIKPNHLSQLCIRT